ncbi:MAG: hypothetical protein AAB649_06060, partial [Patescibacteria group bacterium]
MNVYLYTGRNEETGEMVSGKRDATSHTALGQDLLKEGVLLTSFKLRETKKILKFAPKLFSRVPILERVLFARYFCLMLQAGLDM